MSNLLLILTPEYTTSSINHVCIHTSPKRGKNAVVDNHQRTLLRLITTSSVQNSLWKTEL